MKSSVLRSQSCSSYSRSVARATASARPRRNVSRVAMIASGVALLSEEAGKCYYSPAFRWKMALLASAVLFYFTLHRRALLRTDMEAPTIWSRTAAVVSMMLWLGVGVAGRAIGLL